MSKYRRMVFTSIRESCKSKLPAGGNATWMQGSVKVPGGEVYALPAKRPLTRPPSSGTLSPGRGLSFLVRVEVIKTALSLGERVVRRLTDSEPGEGSPPIPLGFDGTPSHIVLKCKAGFCYLLERRLC